MLSGNPYLQLLRPHTLPLSVCAILAGTAAAYASGSLNRAVLPLSLATALALQIVSNIANDYGDTLLGADRYRDATAPARVSASGSLKPQQIRRCLYAAIAFALCSGWALLQLGIQDNAVRLLFMLLGALSVLAAVSYTLGFPKGYGYYGWGEAAVWLFFGLLAVSGSHYLHTGSLNAAVLLPANGCGLLAAAVLHTNNMRDLNSDAAAGKRTLAGHFGFSGSKKLHIWLNIAGLSCYLAYGCVQPASLLWLVLLPRISRYLRRIVAAEDTVAAGRELADAVKLHMHVNLLFALGICAVA